MASSRPYVGGTSHDTTEAALRPWLVDHGQRVRSSFHSPCSAIFTRILGEVVRRVQMLRERAASVGGLSPQEREPRISCDGSAPQNCLMARERHEFTLHPRMFFRHLVSAGELQLGRIACEA